MTEADYQGRSLKAQFKQADKVGAKLILVLGGDELAAGKVKVRDMESHDEVLVDRPTSSRRFASACSASFELRAA